MVKASKHSSTKEYQPVPMEMDDEERRSLCALNLRSHHRQYDDYNPYILLPMNRRGFMIVVLFGLLCTVSWFMSKSLQHDVPSPSMSLQWCASSAEMRQIHIPAEMCQCADPTKSDDWFENRLWLKKHELLVEQANKHADGKGEMLDVVILGDSITERMNGRSNFQSMSGVTQLPEMLNLYRSILTRDAGGKLDSLALGISGDTSPNLLWHLEHDMLPQNLDPKVWMLLIGTNDLGRTLCNKETTFAGIRQVATYLKKKRPHSILLVHGLLPRSDFSMAASMKEGNYKMGYFWKQIQWINSQLKDYCESDISTPTCHYMETIDVFLESDSRIDPRTMPDGLHPSAKGYEKWLPRIAAEVERLIDVRV